MLWSTFAKKNIDLYKFLIFNTESNELRIIGTWPLICTEFGLFAFFLSEMIFSVSTKANILEESSQPSGLRTFNQSWTTEEQVIHNIIWEQNHII